MGNIHGANVLEATVEVPDLPSGSSLRLVFDVDDKCVAPDDLRGADYYFSRSLNARVLASHPRRDHMLPLGLIYPVYAVGSWPVRRALWARKPAESAKILVRHIPLFSSLLRVQSSSAVCRPFHFEGRPRADAEPRILFMTQTWDPERIADPAEREDRKNLNEMRAECIRALRRHFPNLFFGGLRHSQHASEHYRDCLLPGGNLSHKSSYLKLMHASSICVATTGLQGSTGWKLGEYVAAAKAIVTEPPLTAQPGPFGEPVNYLTYRTPNECVEVIGTLVDSPARRLEMMRANLTYYHGYLRPDMLVWNAITNAILMEAEGVPPVAALELSAEARP